ncbi:MAG: hypothetical protein R3B06_22145 [Kofleriaceae bacterium]
MLTPHSPDLEQLAGIGAVRHLRGDRPATPPVDGGDEPGWIRTLPFPVGESSDNRVPSETERTVHIWVQVAPLSAADFGLARQAVWSLHPALDVTCPDPDRRLVCVAFSGASTRPVRDWIRAVVQIPLVALHASRPIASVLISLEP